TGSYSLVTSLDDYGNTIGDARTVSLGNTTLGNINVAGDEDYFKIVIPSAGTLTVKTTGSTDTYGYLLDASNSEIESNDDGGLDRNFQISKFITTAGTYYVKVKHHDPSENMGAYSLVTYFDDHNNSKDGATPINPNSRTVGRIEKTGDVDWFKIVIPSGGGTLIVSTTGTIDTSGELYKDGDLNASDNNNGSGNNFKISQQLEAGTYYVKVSASSTGEYWLDSQFIAPVTGSLSDNDNNISTATYIEVNTTTEPISTTGRIDVAGDNDYFKIVTTGPGRLIVKTRRSDGDDIDTYGYLLDANGEELASNNNSGIYPKHFLIVKYITAGTYYVRVRGFNNDVTGAYTLDVQFEPGLTEVSDDHSNSIVGATPINPNSRTAGKLDFGQDEDYFKVIIPESGTLTVTTETNPVMDTYGYLYDEKGDAIVRNNNGSTVNFRISRSVTAGIYYVKVKGRSRSTTGEYTLVAQFTPDQ
ncbi:MAG: pre-peptidase C-terminal domain-containing protein, partial [Sulfurovum sp.]|nr:pre-peptidase C-terminal domain-containing protein [Sulfurovum sp.]